MQIEQSLKDLIMITNLASIQLVAVKSCNENKVEVFIGRNADGKDAPKEVEAVAFGRTDTIEKLILVGGIIKNYETVTDSKDIYFVSVTFENCGKLPAKSRMIGCKIKGVKKPIRQ